MNIRWISCALLATHALACAAPTTPADGDELANSTSGDDGGADDGSDGRTSDAATTGPDPGTTTVPPDDGTSGGTTTDGRCEVFFPPVAPDELPPATVDTPYAVTLSIPDLDDVPWTWTVTGLPAPLTFDPNLLTIAGTPTTPGTFPIDVHVTIDLVDQCTLAPTGNTYTLLIDR